MPDLSQLSNEELLAMRQRAASAPDLSKMSNQDLMALRQKMAGSIKPIGPSSGESAMRGAAEGMTAGLADEAYGVLSGIINPGNVAPEKGFFEGFPERYAAGRDYARRQDRAAAEAHPVVYHGSELAAGIASPLSKAFAPAKGAGVAKTVALGAGYGATAGFGNSTAKSPEQLGLDVLEGASVGGGMALGGRLASDMMGALTPDKLKAAGSKYLARAAGTSDREAAAKLAAEDAAGPAVAGYGSTAESIAEGAGQKAKFFEDQAAQIPQQRTWRPFGGGAPKPYGAVSEEAAAAQQAAQNDAGLYRKLAEDATAKAEKQGGMGDMTLPLLTGAASLAHTHNPMAALAITAASKGVPYLAKTRGNAFMGRAATDLGEAFSAAPESVGTAAGAAKQFLASGMGGQMATEQVLGMQQPSAAELRSQHMAERERRLQQVMQGRMADLAAQGYPAAPVPLGP